MPKKLTKWFNEHQFPEVFYRFPGLVSLQWVANRILFHRSWLIRHSVGSSLKQFASDLSFLDAGCGTGDFMIPFARRYPDGHFVGIDKSPENVRLLNSYILSRHLSNVTMISGDLQEMNPDHRFSVVLIASVLHLLTDRLKVFGTLSEKMISGGCLLIYVPVNYRRRLPGYKWLREKFFQDEDYYQGKDARRDLTLETLSLELAATGFTVIKYRRLYGPAGQVGYEISSMALLVIQKVPWFFSILLGLLYYPILHPLVLLLFLIDYFGCYKEGNGLLITAERN